MPVLGAAAYSELLTATFNTMDTDGAVDNIFKSDPLLAVLRPLFTSATGPKLQCNLELADGSATEWVADKSGTHSTAVSPDVLGVALFDWSQILISHTRIQWLVRQMTTGPKAIEDLNRVHVANAMSGHTLAISTALGALKTAETGGVVSFDRLISATEPVGGIDPAVQLNWVSFRAVNDPATVTPAQALRNLTDGVNDIGGNTDGGIILAGPAAFRAYQDSLDAKVRYNNFAVGETNFRQLEFDGIVIRRVRNFPTARFMFLQPKTLRLHYLNSAFAEVQPLQAIPTTLDHEVPIASVISLGTTKRKDQGIVDYRTGVI